jgi:hypothetical protein
MRLGRQAAERQLLQGTVLSAAGKTRSTEGHLRCRRLDTDRDLYHILKDGVPHEDLGIDYFDKRKPEGRVKRLVAPIATLGFEARLHPIAKAA